jgi:hypothetical protein
MLDGFGEPPVEDDSMCARAFDCYATSVHACDTRSKDNLDVLGRLNDSKALRYSTKYDHVPADLILFDRVGLTENQPQQTVKGVEFGGMMDVCECNWLNVIDACLGDIDRKRVEGVYEPLLDEIVTEYRDESDEGGEERAILRPAGEREKYEASLEIDEDLKMRIKELVLLIQRRNLAAGLSPYTDAEVQMLVWELWYVDFLHNTDVRKPRADGTSYSRSHLFGALRNAVTVLGITDLTFLLAVIHHDDYEDVKVLHGSKKSSRQRNFLSAYELYEGEIDYADLNVGNFSGDPREYIKARLMEQHNWVSSVSVLKDIGDVGVLVGKDGVPPGKKLKEFYNFYLFLESIDKYGLMVALLKLSDRKHNSGTFKGLVDKSGDEVAKFKAEATAKVYGEVAEIIGCEEMRAGIVGDCFKFLKKDLVEEFESFRDSVIKRHLKRPASKKGEPLSPDASLEVAFDESLLNEKLLSLLELDRFNDSIIDFLAVVPACVGSSKYFDGGRIGDDDYSPTSEIDRLDPMFEVVVLVKSLKNVEENRGRIDQMQERLVRALSPGAVMPLRKVNGSMTIFIPELGGRVNLRVTDTQGDMFSQSGFVKSRKKSGRRKFSARLPRVRDAALQEVVANIRGLVGEPGTDDYRPGEYESVYSESERLLKKPTIQVFTKSGVAIELPARATVWDFAAKIHKDLVGKMSGATIRKSVFDEHPKHVLPTRELKDGDVVEVLIDGPPLVSAMHQYFITKRVNTTRRALRRALSEGKDASDIFREGRVHLEELADLFGAEDSEDVLRYLALHIGQASMYRFRDFYERDIVRMEGYLDDADDDPHALDWEADSLEKRLNSDRCKLSLAQADIVDFEDDYCNRVASLDLNVNALRILGEAVDVGGGIDVSVEMPHVPNMQVRFNEEFGTDKVNTSHFDGTEIFEKDGQKIAKVHLRLELPEDGSSSVYEILKWILHVSQKPEHAIKVTSDHFRELFAKTKLKPGDDSEEIRV